MTDIIDPADIIDLGYGGAHSDRSPSAADRWIPCPGSVALSRLFPDEPTIYAAEGTAAHYVREQCLRTGADVADFTGRIIHADGYYFEVLPEWEDFLQPTIDWAREQGGEMVVEQRVPLAPWLPEDAGTLDLGIILPDLIIINDLKFGEGMLVEAERNRQQMLYAVCFWQNYARHRTSATRFRLMIDQPRAWGGRGSEWECDLDELLAFAEVAAEAGRLSQLPDAPFKPTVDGCHFCVVAENMACAALHDFCQELVGINPDVARLKGDPEVADIDTMTPERRSYIIEHTPLINRWLRGVNAFQLNEALVGNPTPGFKVVGTEGNRAWRSEEEAEEFLKSKMPIKDIFNQKLKSPPQIEKLIGTRNWLKAQALIVRPEGPPSLVPESDKRPALLNAMDLLPDLGDDDDERDDAPAGTANQAGYQDDLI